MHFSIQQKVLFRHCDPAGIAFYPRIFEMINDAVEAMFSDCLDWPFEAMHPFHAVPTAAMNIRFQAPCRHGDRLELRLTIKELGASSLALNTKALAGEGLRFEADQTLVCVGADTRPARWPETVRQKITDLMEVKQ